MKRATFNILFYLKKSGKVKEFTPPEIKPFVLKKAKMSLSGFVPYVIVPSIYKIMIRKKISFFENLPYGTKIGG
jgi:hypothetical protein